MTSHVSYTDAQKRRAINGLKYFWVKGMHDSYVVPDPDKFGTLKDDHKLQGLGLKLESSEQFKTTDLICEGPVEGLVDHYGSTLKYVYGLQTSDISLGKGVYYNNVPLIDPKSNKFNFVNGGFKINYGEKDNKELREFPSTVYRYRQKIFLNDAYAGYWGSPTALEESVVIVAPDGHVDNSWRFYYANGQSSCVVNYYSTRWNEDFADQWNFKTFLIPSNEKNPINDDQGENHINHDGAGSWNIIPDKFQLAEEYCTPFIHKVRNKYCDVLRVQIYIDQLFNKSTGSNGDDVASELCFLIRIFKDNSEEVFYSACSITGIVKGGNFIWDLPYEVELDPFFDGDYYVSISPLSVRVPISVGTHFKGFGVHAVVEQVTKCGYFSYPYSVTVKNKVSSKHFKTDPERSFDLKLLKIKIPDNYDPEIKEYSGDWGGNFDSFLRWTDNPAWAFYDICTNQRYGLGNSQLFEEDLNKWQLYKIAKYCDELIETSVSYKYTSEQFRSVKKEPEGNSPNYIYISIKQFIEVDKSERTIIKTRTNDEFQIRYPPVNFSQDDLANSDGIDEAGVPMTSVGHNGGEQNSIIWLHGIIDSNGNKIEKVIKKIIWKVEQGFYSDGDENEWEPAAFGAGNVGRMTLINDFGPRKMFESEKTGLLLKSFVRYAEADVKDDEKGYANRRTPAREQRADGSFGTKSEISRKVTASQKNSQDSAKAFILREFVKILKEENTQGNIFSNNQKDKEYFFGEGATDEQINQKRNSLKNFVQQFIDKPVFPDDWFSGENAEIQGLCLPKVRGFREPFESRFSLNVFIDNETEFLKLINDLSSVFRGITYYRNNVISSTIDVDKPVSYLFNNTNVKDGLFNYSSGSMDGNYTVAKVMYKDVFNSFSDEIEIVEDSKLINEYGIIPKDILGFGVTSKDQAKRLGKWMIATNRFENQTITFSTDIQGLLLQPSDVIQIEDQYKSSMLLQGRIVGINYELGYVTVDRKIDVGLSGSIIKFICDKNYSTVGDLTTSSQVSDLDRRDLLELRIERVENNTNRIYIDKSYKFENFDSVLVSVPFIIEDFLSKKEKNLYKIVSITEEDVNSYSIFAIKHDPNKYRAVESNRFSTEEKDKEKTITFSSSQNLKELDLTGMPKEEEGTYLVLNKIKIYEVGDIDFDYNLTDPASSLNFDNINNYAYVELYFDRIQNYITSYAIRDADGIITGWTNEYFKKAYEALSGKENEKGGGYVCRVILDGRSIRFSVPFDNAGSKKVFLGNFDQDTISSVSTVRIYLYNSKEQIVEIKV